MQEAQSTSLHEGSVAVVPQKAEKKSGKRIGFNYIILKSLKESKKNDVVKCIYIKGITNFGLCVIKEGSRGDTKDDAGRDIQDRLKWQRTLHERLAGKVRVPRYIDSFEENGNYYLVIEHIKGKSFYQLVKGDRSLKQSFLDGSEAGLKMIGYIEQAVELVEELHKHHIIHRDVTLANFMVMPNGKVAVIDLELSYALNEQYPLPPFALGTHGYMSPEQEVISAPTVKQDIFSIGAIILHIWTGISPMKFIKMPLAQYQRAVNFFVEDQAIVDLIDLCTKQEAELRPDTSMILQSLKNHKQVLKNKDKRRFAKKELFTAQEINETIQRGIAALNEPLMNDRAKGWFADHLTERKESVSDIRKTWYASFNRGVSGILYFLSRAYSIGYDLSSVEVPVQQAFDLIRMKYLNNRVESVKAGYYFGSDGIAMCLAEVYRNGWMDAEKTMMADWAYLLSGDTRAMNLGEGKAGQGIAHLHCAGLTPGTREKNFAEDLMESQLPGGNWPLSKKRKLMHIEYGQSGIIYFLLQYGMINNDREALKSAIKGLDYIIANVVKKDDAVTWRKKHRTVVDSRRCEGNPGIAQMFLKAYEATGKNVYREWAERALSGHNENKLWTSLSMCHGIAGLGETYLDAAHILKDEKWLVKAERCIQIVMHMQQKTKNNNTFWYVERERNPVANLFVGNTGVLHFLLRYLNQGKFSFPGMI